MKRAMFIAFIIVMYFAVTAQTFTSRLMRPAGFIMTTLKCAIRQKQPAFGDSVYFHIGHITVLTKVIEVRDYTPKRNQNDTTR